MGIDFRLYLVTDRHQCDPTPLADGVAAALRGGAGAVQLREKDMSARALRELAAQLLPICQRAGVPMLVNDRVDIALAVGADGVHLPANSFSIRDARRLLGANKLIAVSTHSVADVRAAAASGADFAVFGPVFATPSKAAFGPPLGPDLLRAAARATPLPIFAIGGVTPDRAGTVRRAGAHGAAAISALLGATDPERAAREFAAALNL